MGFMGARKAGEEIMSVVYRWLWAFSGKVSPMKGYFERKKEARANQGFLTISISFFVLFGSPIAAVSLNVMTSYKETLDI